MNEATEEAPTQLDTVEKIIFLHRIRILKQASAENVKNKIKKCIILKG